MSETIVLITGANQGLGFEVVKRLAAENAGFKIILGTRDVTKCELAAVQVSKLAQGTQVDVLEIDVTSDESVARAVKTVDEKYGRIDVLFNNAGIAAAQKGTLREEMLAIYDTNAVSVLVVTDAFMPLLIRSEIPRVVIMSSDLGSITNTLNPNHYAYFKEDFAYKMSKVAVNMAGAMYSKKYKKDGVRVNLVNPGLRPTNMNNYTTRAKNIGDGALEACRVITLGDKGDSPTYTEIEGSIEW